MSQKTDAQAVESTATNSKRELVALSQGRGGIFGIKAGMTQVYSPEGDSLAVTVIDVKENVITQIKTKQNEGYTAVQVGFVEKAASKVAQSESGHLKASASTGFYHYEEFRFEDSVSLEGITVGKALSTAFLKAGDLVDLVAVSKGKGFQGGMKRYHMAGGHKTHGASVCHRSLGSIGNRADPGKTFKNKKMPGQMGHSRVTVQNVRVVAVDEQNGLILVHGSIPGPKTGIVSVRKAIKKVGK